MAAIGRPTLRVFSNGDLMLRSPQTVVLCEDGASLDDIHDIVAAVRRQLSHIAAFANITTIHTLDGIPVITLAQLRDGDPVIATVDTSSCLPRIISAVTNFRRSNNVMGGGSALVGLTPSPVAAQAPRPQEPSASGPPPSLPQDVSMQRHGSRKGPLMPPQAVEDTDEPNSTRRVAGDEMVVPSGRQSAPAMDEDPVGQRRQHVAVDDMVPSFMDEDTSPVLHRRAIPGRRIQAPSLAAPPLPPVRADATPPAEAATAVPAKINSVAIAAGLPTTTVLPVLSRRPHRADRDITAKVHALGTTTAALRTWLNDSILHPSETSAAAPAADHQSSNVQQQQQPSDEVRVPSPDAVTAVENSSPLESVGLLVTAEDQQDTTAADSKPIDEGGRRRSSPAAAKRSPDRRLTPTVSPRKRSAVRTSHTDATVPSETHEQAAMHKTRALSPTAVKGSTTRHRGGEAPRATPPARPRRRSSEPEAREASSAAAMATPTNLSDARPVRRLLAPPSADDDEIEHVSEAALSHNHDPKIAADDSSTHPAPVLGFLRPPAIQTLSQTDEEPDDVASAVHDEPSTAIGDGPKSPRRNLHAPPPPPEAEAAESDSGAVEVLATPIPAPRVVQDNVKGRQLATSPRSATFGAGPLEPIGPIPSPDRRPPAAATQAAATAVMTQRQPSVANSATKPPAALSVSSAAANHHAPRDGEQDSDGARVKSADFGALVLAVPPHHQAHQPAATQRPHRTARFHEDAATPQPAWAAVGAAERHGTLEDWETLRRDWTALLEINGFSIHAADDASSSIGGFSAGGHRRSPLFREEMERAVQQSLHNAGIDPTFPRGLGDLKAAFAGPEGSGRVAVLCDALRQLAMPLLRPTSVQLIASDGKAMVALCAPLLTIPLCTSIMLPEAQTDAAVWYCRFVQHAVTCLAAVYLPARAVAASLAAFFKAPVVRRGSLSPMDTRIATAFPEGSTGTWPLLCVAVQTAYTSGHIDDLVGHALRIPQAFREALGMSAVLYLVEDVDLMRQKALVDWRTGATLGNVDLSEALLQHGATSRTTGILFSCLTVPTLRAATTSNAAAAASTRNSRWNSSNVAMTAKWRGAVIQMTGLVSDAVAAKEAGLPLTFICGSRRFPLSIFGGCPGFLALVASHLHGSWHNDQLPASPGSRPKLRMVSSVEAAVDDESLMGVLDELEMLKLHRATSAETASAAAGGAAFGGGLDLVA